MLSHNAEAPHWCIGVAVQHSLNNAGNMLRCNITHHIGALVLRCNIAYRQFKQCTNVVHCVAVQYGYAGARVGGDEVK